MAHSPSGLRLDGASVGAVLPAKSSNVAGLAPASQRETSAPTRFDEAGIQAVIDVAARKYRISTAAMREFVEAAYVEARRNRLDPLLLVAVMAVESRFNPIAQSHVGATGLMQVVPAYHADKFSATNGESVLDPRVNIRVGARVLKEYVARGGTEVAGLQLYNGSSADPGNAYASKVLAERARFREALRRSRERAGALAGNRSSGSMERPDAGARPGLPEA